MNDKLQYWVGFNLVKGIGSARLRLLLDHFGDIEIAWHASAEDLEVAGIGPKLVEAFLQVRNTGELDRTWAYIQENEIEVMTWENQDYPRRLLEIEQPPPVLYVRGKLVDDDQWAVSIVGTRRYTKYGRQVTEQLAGDFCRNGITIVSGLARGIDGIAHNTAIANGGRTIAVLGSGVDRIYPPEHRGLAEKVIANGAIISDYPPGTAPEAGNFPPRNRIISGLSQAVVVVEAGTKSGALITAAFAAEQGREIFAVPGSIYAPQSKGTNLLIREGAIILTDAQSVLEILNFAQVSHHRNARVILPGDETEALLYKILGREPLHVDEIGARSNLPIEKVSSTLTLMELKGLVRQVGSMHYIAVFEPPAEYRINSD